MSKDSTSEKVERNLFKPLLVGGLGSAILYQMPADNYSKINVPVLGQVPAPVFFGACIAGGSFLGEIAHNWVYPSLHVSEKWEEPASAVTSAVLTGGATALGAGMLNSKIIQIEGVNKLVMVGAGAEVLGDYVYSKILSPMLFA